MSWQLLIILHSLILALSVLTLRAVARRKQAEKATFVMGAAQSLVLFLFTVFLLPFVGSIQFDKFTEYFWWFLIGGLASMIGNACIYKVLSYLEAGISSILNTSYVFFTLIFAAIFLNETLTAIQLIGSALLLSAIFYGVWIARHPEIKKRHKTAWRPGLAYATLGGIVVGAALVNEKFLLDRTDIATLLVFALGWQLIFTALAAVIFQRNKLILLKDKQILKLNTINGILRAFSGIFLVAAMAKSNNVAVVTVLGNFKIIFVILLGAILLNEHQKLSKKMIAATIATTGMLIVFLE